MKTLHIPCYSTTDPLPTLKENIGVLADYSSVGVVASAQHLNSLDVVRDYLTSRGKRVEVGGQVLGCAQDNALRLDVDCILYVGSGKFHPLGIALKTSKPVYILNPISQVLDTVKKEDIDRILKKRKGAIVKALTSDTFGIMVSTKKGQYRLDEALKIKQEIMARGRKAYIIAGDDISPANILPLKVDCLINTACPRIEADQYHVPVLNPDEVRQMIELM